MLDYNLATRPAAASSGSKRAAPILGFNIPEAVLLANTGRSLYNSLQLNLMKRMSNGLQFNLVLHLLAVEGHELGGPGQHGRRRQAGRAERRLRGAGRPAQPRRELRAVRLRPAAPVQRQLRVRAARAASRAASASRASCRCSPGCRTRSSRRSRNSATPCAVRERGPRLRRPLPPRRSDGRASAVRSTTSASQAADPIEAAFNKRRCSARRTTAAGGYPDNLGFGNLGRNVLRGFWQRRVDLSLAKTFTLGGERRRAPLGRVQRVQHGELRAARKRDRRSRAPTSARSPNRSAVRASCSSGSG